MKKDKNLVHCSKLCFCKK